VEITIKYLYILQPYISIGFHKKCFCPYHAALDRYYHINYYISYYMFASRHTT